MISKLGLLSVFLLVVLTESIVLKTTMINDYSQVALPGCESRKANIFYDRKQKLWIEHLTSSCEMNFKEILQFCQTVYPSLNVTNIAPLITSLSFKNWCEMVPSDDEKSLPSCEITMFDEEIVTPYRCLHEKSSNEELNNSPGKTCRKQQIIDSSKCLSISQLKQRAILVCNDHHEVLNSSLTPLTTCGLAKFNSIEFYCCSFADSSSTTNEDDPIEEVVVVPQKQPVVNSIFPKEPEWYEDDRQSNDNEAFFANDEDLRDEQKSHLTMNEHRRFSDAKNKFRENYQQKINDLKTQWETRLADIQTLANKNSIAAQRDYENADFEFRRAYDQIKRQASRERIRINEEHEKNLDEAIRIAQSQVEEDLNSLWNSPSRQIEEIGEAFYRYIHILLRDRIHLVNRYERLRAVDPEQAEEKRVVIHERLNVIEHLIDEALKQLKDESDLDKTFVPRINRLIDEYDEVNVQAKKLLTIYQSRFESTTLQNRRLSDHKISSSIDDIRHLSYEGKSSLQLSKYWIWPILIVIIVLILIGLCLLRCVIIQRRNHSSYRNRKNDKFTSVEIRSADEENLRALQANGYENPTYKFFEKKHPHC